MGRAKLAIKFMEDPKARNATFCRRKEGLKKKAYEFSTLCGVDTCLICYKEDSNKPITWPEDRQEVDRIIRRYLMVSEYDEEKKKRRMQDNLATSHQENTNKPMFPTWDDRLDNWPVSSLRELVSNLDEKIERVRKRIKLLTISNSNPCLEQSNQQVEVSSCNFLLHQPYPLSCVNTEQQHSYGKDFLRSPARLETNSILNPSPHFEQFSDTDNFNSISTLPLFNQESSASALPLFNQESSVSSLPLFKQESSVSTLPLFKQESSVSMVPLFNQEIGVVPIMKSWMLSQSNEFDGYSTSIFHQQQCFQGNQCFGLSDFLPMNPQSFQTMLLHPQTHHLDLGLPEFQDFKVTQDGLGHESGRFELSGRGT